MNNISWQAVNLKHTEISVETNCERYQGNWDISNKFILLNYELLYQRNKDYIPSSLFEKNRFFFPWCFEYEL